MKKKRKEPANRTHTKTVKRPRISKKSAAEMLLTLGEDLPANDNGDDGFIEMPTGNEPETHEATNVKVVSTPESDTGACLISQKTHSVSQVRS